MRPEDPPDTDELRYIVERFGAYVRSLYDCLTVAALNQAAAAKGKPPVVSAEEIDQIRRSNEMHYGEGASWVIHSHWIGEKRKLLDEVKPDVDEPRHEDAAHHLTIEELAPQTAQRQAAEARITLAFAVLEEVEAIANNPSNRHSGTAHNMLAEAMMTMEAKPDADDR